MTQRIANYLLPALRIQIFITLVSLPILVLWGLPISSLSILGNLIFAPLLSLFLLLSSLIFFLEIACLPNHWLILILEKLTAFWLSLTPNHPQRYLLLFPQITAVLFIIAILMASYVIINLNLNKIKQVMILGIILITSCLCAKLPIWIQTPKQTLNHRHRYLTIDYESGKLTIKDHGILSSYAGIESWINYTLSPTLIKNFGTLTVNDLYLQKNTKTTCRNLELLKNHLIIENVHLL